MEFPNRARIKVGEDTERDVHQMEMNVAVDGDVAGALAGDAGVGLETMVDVEVLFPITMALMDLIFVESLNGLRLKSMI